MTIEILGHRDEESRVTEMNIRKALIELNLKAKVVRVTDIEDLSRRCVVMTPEIVVDGDLESRGRIPSVEHVKEMLSARDCVSRLLSRARSDIMGLTGQEEFSARETLRDGRPVQIRAIRPDDKQALLDGFHRMSTRSVYFRFLTGKRELTKRELAYFTEIDFIHHVGIAAFHTHDGKEKLIGVGRYVERCPPAAVRRAEVAFAVDDAYQGLGLGSRLLHHLVSIARANGIDEFEAEILADNHVMLKMLAHSGFNLKRSIEAGVVHVSFPIRAGQSELAENGDGSDAMRVSKTMRFSAA